MNARMVDALGMRIAYHIQTFTVYVRQCDGVETTTEVAASAQSRKMKIVSTTKRKKKRKGNQREIKTNKKYYWDRYLDINQTT